MVLILADRGPAGMTYCNGAAQKSQDLICYRQQCFTNNVCWLLATDNLLLQMPPCSHILLLLLPSLVARQLHKGPENVLEEITLWDTARVCVFFPRKCSRAKWPQLWRQHLTGKRRFAWTLAMGQVVHIHNFQNKRLHRLEAHFWDFSVAQLLSINSTDQ